MSLSTAAVSWDRLRLIDGGDWRLDTEPPNSVEVVIEGNAIGPVPDAKALATRILGDLPTFLTEARGYLETFILPSHFDSKGHWSADGLRFCDGDRTFEVELSLEDDVYGYWTVTFASLPGRQQARPIRFARNQT